MTFIGILCSVVFPIVFLITTSLATDSMITSITFSLATFAVLFIIVFPKLSILVRGGDIDPATGFRPKKVTSILRVRGSWKNSRVHVKKNFYEMAAVFGDDPIPGDNEGLEGSEKNQTDELIENIRAMMAPADLGRGKYADKATLCMEQIRNWEQFILVTETRFSLLDGHQSHSLLSLPQPPPPEDVPSVFLRSTRVFVGSPTAFTA